MLFLVISVAIAVPIAVMTTPVPLALMGLNEGVNTFIDSDGKPLDEGAYMPAYLRRYPFMLAKLRPDEDHDGGGFRRHCCPRNTAPA